MKIKRIIGIFLVILLITLFPQFISWSIKHFVTGLNSYAGFILLGIALVISISLFILSYRWVKKNDFESSGSEPAILFSIGAFCWLVSWFVYQNSAIDKHLHSIIYSNSSPWMRVKISTSFAIISGIYFLVPLIFKLNFNIRLARIHFWVTFIGLVIVLTVTGLDMEISRPRRYTDYGGWNIYSRIDYYRLVILFPIIAVVIAQFVFIFNIIYAILTPRRIR